jgi:ACDE family multidrug resistance protein
MGVPWRSFGDGEPKLRGIHIGVWLGTAGLPSATTFASLFGLQAFCRTILLTVIPVEALARLGDAQDVSLFYFGVSIASMSCSLLIPSLIHIIRRRRVIALGTIATSIAAVLFQHQGIVTFCLAMWLMVLGFIAWDIALNLYVLDHIPRREVGRFEPLRVMFAGAGFTIGPYLGVLLRTEVGYSAPFILLVVAVTTLYAIFTWLRLSEHPAIQAARRPPPNPLRFFPRYFRQPRLRLAYVLAVGRSGWWSMFFVYAPIFCVQSGLGEQVGGALVSGVSMAMLLVPLWGAMGRWWGIRRLLLVGYAGSGLASLAVAFAMGSPWLGVAVLVAAGLITSIIDGAGNLLFLRAVRPHERAEMTSVFVTFRDCAQTAPPGIFAALLHVFALPAVFVAGGIAMLGLAGLTRHVPKRY